MCGDLYFCMISCCVKLVTLFILKITFNRYVATLRYFLIVALNIEKALRFANFSQFINSCNIDYLITTSKIFDSAEIIIS